MQTAFKKNVITEWEPKFSFDITGKKQLSVKQNHIKDIVKLKVDLHAANIKSALNDFDSYEMDPGYQAPKQTCDFP